MDTGGLAQLGGDKGRALSRGTSVGLWEQPGVSAP